VFKRVKDLRISREGYFELDKCSQRDYFCCVRYLFSRVGFSQRALRVWIIGFLVDEIWTQSVCVNPDFWAPTSHGTLL
jgi:hypothetical protein